MTRPSVVVAIAAAAMVGTLPGRTQGLGLITEPLLTELGISRVSYATLNFWATILGAAGAIGVGRLLDRAGTRGVLVPLSLALGAVVITMSRVTTFAALAIAVTLTRALGQSALSVVSIAMIGRAGIRRLDAAMAAYSIALSVGFMIAFPLVGALVQRAGWRAAWLAIGAALIAGLSPLGLLLGGDSAAAAEASGQPGARRGPAPGDSNAGYHWTEAVRTPAFWVFAVGAALYGLIASGIGLFNQSILAERGFGADVYYQTLAVTAITALAGNFLGGWLGARITLTRLMAAALAVLAGGVAALPQLDTMAHVMTWAVAMGVGGGLVMVLFFSVWPRVYGRRHLGRIQGIAQALTVFASALGPVLLARGVEITGSYAMTFRLLAVIIGLTAAAAALTAVPPPAPAPARGTTVAAT